MRIPKCVALIYWLSDGGEDIAICPYDWSLMTGAPCSTIKDLNGCLRYIRSKIM